MPVVERALSVRAEQARLELQTTLGTLAATTARDSDEARAMMKAKLREMSEQSAQRLAAI